MSDAAYLKNLIRWGANEFFVSVQGLEETHDAVTRTAGAFRETMAGLDNLSVSGIDFITNSVVTRRNLRELPALMDYLAGRGAGEVHLWNFFPMRGTDNQDLIVSVRELISMLPYLSSVMRRAGKPLIFKGFPKCLDAGSPVFFDSRFPATVLPETFWAGFQECGFGTCAYRGTCQAGDCWASPAPMSINMGMKGNSYHP